MGLILLLPVLLDLFQLLQMHRFQFNLLALLVWLIGSADLCFLFGSGSFVPFTLSLKLTLLGNCLGHHVEGSNFFNVRHIFLVLSSLLGVNNLIFFLIGKGYQVLVLTLVRLDLLHLLLVILLNDLVLRVMGFIVYNTALIKVSKNLAVAI